MNSGLRFAEALSLHPEVIGPTPFELKDVQAFFEVGDKVSFKTVGGKKMEGTVEKLNAKRAIVKCVPTSWNVSYHGLDHLSPEMAVQRMPRADRLKTVAVEARQKMDLHGLKDWRLGFSAAKRRYGMCSYKRRTIEISLHHAVDGLTDEVVDTILHEIAHALAGPSAGHGPKWKQIAISIGATPKACAPLDAESLREVLAAKQSFNVGDVVAFSGSGKRKVGRIIRKNQRRASIEVEGGTWLVAYSSLESVPESEAREFTAGVLQSPKEGQPSTDYAIGDRVRVESRDKVIFGVVTRIHRKTMRVRQVSDGTEWRVSFSLVKKLSDHHAG